MNLRESIHNELLNVYSEKNTTIEERYEKFFGGREITTEQDIELLGYYILHETFRAQKLEEGLWDTATNFLGGLFSNFGGNVKEQLKEWLIGKLMDWFVKPFIGKIGGEDGQLYESIKQYIQVTFADMPFTDIVSTITDCSKMTKLLILGLFEYMIVKMLGSLNLDSVIIDNMRQQLDKVLIEDSAMVNKLTDMVDEFVCSKTGSIKDKLKDFDLDFSFA